MSSVSDRLRRDGPWLLGLSLAWSLLAVLLDARGEFPLNDDWGYAPAVFSLVRDGQLQFTDWQSAPLLTHVLYGAAFAAPFGATYEVLRVAMLFAGGAGVLALYWLLREAGAEPHRAALGAALLLANPIYVVLSASFMSDVTFVAMLTAASAAWLRAERTRSSWMQIAAFALALSATLNRQLGLALPLAWMAVSALEHGLGRRWLLRAALPAFAIAASLVAYERIIDSTLGLPALYHVKGEQLMAALSELARGRGLRFPLGRSAMAVGYLGLFTLPLALTRIRARPWLPLLGGLVGLALALAGVALPWTGNVLVDLGVGPRTMLGSAPHAPSVIWAVASVLAGAGAGAFVDALLSSALALVRAPSRSLRERARPSWSRLRRAATERSGRARLLAVAVAVVGLTPTLIVFAAFFDRYLLTALPFAAVLVALPAHAPRDDRAAGAQVVVDGRA